MKKILKAIANFFKPRPKPVIVQPLPKVNDPEVSNPNDAHGIPWLGVAEREIGTKEIVGKNHNPRVIEYHSATKLNAKDDETAWCASFVCWVLKTAGYKHTASAWARDYLNYGTKLTTPKKGCIVVFKRNETSGHVGFYMGETSTHIKVLGGNQSNAVNISSYKKSDLLGYRWPIK